MTDQSKGIPLAQRLREEGERYESVGRTLCAYHQNASADLLEQLTEALEGLLEAYDKAFDETTELPPETIDAEWTANKAIQSARGETP